MLGKVHSLFPRIAWFAINRKSLKKEKNNIKCNLGKVEWKPNAFLNSQSYLDISSLASIFI